MKRALTDEELADQDIATLMTHAYTLYMNGDPVGARLEAAFAAEAVPRCGLAQAELGRRLMSIDEPDGAETALRLACDLGVKTAATVYELGRALLAQGRREDAICVLRQSLCLDPARAAAWADLGQALCDSGQMQAALDAFTRAARLDRNNGTVRRMLGLAQGEAGLWSAAVATLKAACSLAPGDSGAWNAWGRILLDHGRPVEAQRALVRASRLDPSNPALLSHCLHARAILPGQTSAQIARLFRVWQTRFGTPIPPRPSRAAGTPFGPQATGTQNTPLRVGILWTLPDTHPAGFALRSLLRHRDRTRLAIVIFDDQRADAPVVCHPPLDPGALLRTESATLADAWLPVRGQSNEVIAKQVRRHGLDVLVDLGGHSPGNRLPLFARLRPAPVQASWTAGALGSSGVRTMDLLIGDGIRLPANEDGDYPERVIRLPLGTVTFEPLDDLVALRPDSQRPPREIHGTITLGTAAPPSQVGTGCLDLWAGVLRALPTARFLAVGQGWTDPEIADRLRTGLRSRGIAPDRLRLFSPETPLERWDALRHLDVLLDSWPWSCDLPVLEALALGVPVVTLPGGSAAGRIAASHLVHTGRPQGVATSRDGYVQCVQEALYTARTPAQWDAQAWTNSMTEALVRSTAAVLQATDPAD